MNHSTVLESWNRHSTSLLLLESFLRFEKRGGGGVRKPLNLPRVAPLKIISLWPAKKSECNSFERQEVLPKFETWAEIWHGRTELSPINRYG